MHGFWRLNILRGFTISSLLLVFATSILVIGNNFVDNDWTKTFFSSLNHLLLIAFVIFLVVSEIGIPQSWFRKYFPLIGPDSSLVVLGLIQWVLASYMLSDRHCVITNDSPKYLSKLLLATGIISGVSGLFNISASTLFRGSKAGKMRTIRRYGTPAPDTEKGYISDASSDGNSGSIVSGFKNAFRGNTAEESPRPAIQISHPIPN